jgi:hypothetical protein
MEIPFSAMEKVWFVMKVPFSVTELVLSVMENILSVTKKVLLVTELGRKTVKFSRSAAKVWILT